MGYFDGLVDAVFKRDPEGKNMLFYPWGALGSGIILVTDEKYLKIRTIIKRLTIFSFVLIVISTLTVGSVATFALLPPYVIGYYFFIRKITKGLTRTDEKLRVLEAYRNSARSFNWSTLVFLAITGFVLVAGSMWQLIHVTSLSNLFLPLAGTILFGFGNCVLVYMMITKYKEK